jgi:quinol monooxygenase YgiN
VIVLIVSFSVKREDLKQVLELGRLMQEHSRLEPGCRSYVVHQQIGDPLRLCFYEAYDDEAAIAAHRSSAHYQHYVANGLMRLIENPVRERYQPVTDLD